MCEQTYKSQGNANRIALMVWRPGGGKLCFRGDSRKPVSLNIICTLAQNIILPTAGASGSPTQTIYCNIILLLEETNSSKQKKFFKK